MSNYYQPRLPWTIEKSSDGLVPFKILNNACTVIARANSVQVANLILAAPAMLAQLRKLHGMMVPVAPSEFRTDEIITLKHHDVIELENSIDELGYREEPVIAALRDLVNRCDRAISIMPNNVFLQDVVAGIETSGARKVLKESEGGWL